MPLPSNVIAELHLGWSVAAELPTEDPDHRAYVMVIPQVPDWHLHPEAWHDIDWALPTPLYALRTPTSISGFEIRYVSHNAKYTDTEWGWDADGVLDDKSTRVRRVFVSAEDEIEAALSPWLSELPLLRRRRDFDSSLVNSPIEKDLSDVDRYPHLWQ